MVVEAAQLKKHLLLLQIENLENELLPCEESLAGCLMALKQGHEVPDKLLLKKARETFSQLRRLKNELSSTEQVLDVASRFN
jgi:hypothetical protein